MNSLQKIEEILKQYPDAQYKVGLNSIVVVPSENGFEVGIELDSNSASVHFDGWHEEFEEDEEAIDCFAFGLSDACRLRILQRGKTDFKWIVESKENNEWKKDSETGLFFFPFWLPMKERILQNHLFKAA